MEPLSQTRMKTLTDAYLESLLADLPSEAELAGQQILSKRFLRRMGRLAGGNRRTPRTWKKTLLVAAIVGTILATAVSAYAYRETIATFFVEVYEKYSERIFPSQSETNDPANESEPGNGLEDNLPSEIPAGYKETDRLLLKGLLQITYTDAAGNILLFDKTEQGNQRIGINTEGVEVEEMMVNGHQGLYYSNLGQNNLLWTDGKYVYFITGIITKEAIINIANTTK